MTRIIAGYAGSLPLKVPERGTRPTSDRVREAIFSRLDARDLLHGASVLDLYAGSGALGLEAASRGAERIVLVERDAKAAAICKRNSATVVAASRSGGTGRGGSGAAAERTAPSVDVVALSVQRYLLGGSATSFDIVFIDPPYELSEDELTADLAALPALLAEDATVMVERSSRSPEPAWPAGLTADKRKDYGDTTIWWAIAD